MPIPASCRPCGNEDCEGFCTGHFLKPSDVFSLALPVLVNPPPVI